MRRPRTPKHGHSLLEALAGFADIALTQGKAPQSVQRLHVIPNMAALPADLQTLQKVRPRLGLTACRHLYAAEGNMQACDADPVVERLDKAQPFPSQFLRPRQVAHDQL